MKVCSVEGCEKQHKAKGYCRLHHGRWLLHGDPTYYPPVNRTKQTSPEAIAKRTATRRARGNYTQPESAKQAARERESDPTLKATKSAKAKALWLSASYRERQVKSHTTTGTSALRNEHKREYTSWDAMKTRCLNKNVPDYLNYGGRGVQVCERWLGPEGFICFLADMGERPHGTSLDRIDVDGNYDPSNCRWATQSAQMFNRRPKTLCKRGHPLEGNVYLVGGRRNCRLCTLMRQKEHRVRQTLRGLRPIRQA